MNRVESAVTTTLPPRHHPWQSPEQMQSVLRSVSRELERGVGSAEDAVFLAALDHPRLFATPEQRDAALELAELAAGRRRCDAPVRRFRHR